MMTEDEKAFLAQVALGWFQIRADGTIWRAARFQGGGAPSLLRVALQRAERSRSRKGGYLRVMFQDGKRRRKIAAHRIIWMVQHQRPIPEGMEINHIDGNKQNNQPSNLEIVTHQGNTLHSFRTLERRNRGRPGSDNPTAKLTETQVVQIRALWARKAMTQREIGQHFGVRQTTVNNIVQGHTWRHILP